MTSFIYWFHLELARDTHGWILNFSIVFRSLTALNLRQLWFQFRCFHLLLLQKLLSNSFVPSFRLKVIWLIAFFTKALRIQNSILVVAMRRELATILFSVACGAHPPCIVVFVSMRAIGYLNWTFIALSWYNIDCIILGALFYQLSVVWSNNFLFVL